MNVYASDKYICLVDLKSQNSCWSYEKRPLYHSQYKFEQILLPHSLKRNVKKLTFGREHFCGLSEYGKLSCWGVNRFGQVDVPEHLKNLSIVDFSTGSYHTCAIDVNGKVHCWGHKDGVKVPTAIKKYRFVQVSSGSSTTCALDDRHKIHCWGDNDSSYSKPYGLEEWIEKTNKEEVKSVSLNNNTIVVINKKGNLSYKSHFKGSGYYYPISSKKRAAKIFTGYFSVCFLDVQGYLECGGDVINSKLLSTIPDGLTFSMKSLIPLKINNAEIFKHLQIKSIGFESSFKVANSYCVLNIKNELYCVYINDKGKVIESNKLTIFRSKRPLESERSFQIVKDKIYKIEKEYFEKLLLFADTSRVGVELLRGYLSGLRKTYFFSDKDWASVESQLKNYLKSPLEFSDELPGYFKGLDLETFELPEASLRYRDFYELIKGLSFLLIESETLYPKKYKEKVKEIINELNSFNEDYANWSTLKIHSFQDYLTNSVSWLHVEIYSKDGYLSSKRGVVDTLFEISKHKVLSVDEEINYFGCKLMIELKKEEEKIREVLLKRSYQFDEQLVFNVFERFFVIENETEKQCGKFLLKNSYIQRKSLVFMRQLSKNYLRESSFHGLDLHFMAYEYLANDFYHQYIKKFNLKHFLKEEMPLSDIREGMRSVSDLRRNLELQLILLKTSTEIVPKESKKELAQLIKDLVSVISTEKFNKHEIERINELANRVKLFSEKVFFESEYLDKRHTIIRELIEDVKLFLRL